MVKFCYCQLRYKIETFFFINIQCGHFNALNVSKGLKNGFVIIDCVIIIGLDTAHCSSLTHLQDRKNKSNTYGLSLSLNVQIVINTRYCALRKLWSSLVCVRTKGGWPGQMRCSNIAKKKLEHNQTATQAVLLQKNTFTDNYGAYIYCKVHTL